MEAAAALSYRPNGLARSMITGVTHSIGVILADIENPFFYGALRGITDVARSRGFDLLLANTDENPDNERQALSSLAERRVEGLIVCPADGEDYTHLQSIMRSGTALVLLDRPVPGLNADTVGLENRRAASEATQHLIDLGHRKIALVTGMTPSLTRGLHRPDLKGVERSAATTTGLRAAGYRDALISAGIELRRDYVAPGGFHREDARVTTRALMSLNDPPTAIVAFDSVLTLGTLLALQDLNLDCPDDVSVVGFDDPEWAEVVSPPLSVVRQPVYDIGSKACELLLQRIGNSTRKPSRHWLKGSLVKRQSTAPPR
jgi:LacI family transcriptional regulator